MTTHSRRTLGFGMLVVGSVLAGSRGRALPPLDEPPPAPRPLPPLPPQHLKRRWVPPRAVALLMMLAALASLTAGVWAYWGHTEDLPGLQLAGRADVAWRILSPHGPLDPAAVQPYRDALLADYRLIVGYTACLVLLALVGWLCFERPGARRIALMGLVAALVAGALDTVENLAVTRGIGELIPATTGGLWWWRAAATADVLKLALLVPTVAVAVVTLLVVGRRALSPQQKTRCRVVPGPETVDRPSGYLPPAVAAERPAGKVGVCVSGGGIRSACVTLGALQKLRPAGWLRDDGYLFSVSGGGYLAGALRLAMQPEDPGDPPVADRIPALYEQDTPELEHLRAHGRYVAQGVRQWVIGLGVVLAHLSYSFFQLAAVSVGVGLVLGLFYSWVPLVGPGLSDAFAGFPPRDTAGATWALGTAVALTVLLWLVAGAREGRRGVPSRGWRAGVRVAAGLTLLIVVLTLLVPALVWAVTHYSTIASALGAGSGVLTVATTLVTMASKSATGAAGKTSGLTAGLPMRIAVVAAVALLALGMLLVMAATIHLVVTGAWLVVLGLAVGVLVAALAALFFDQTQASLHRFYRQRLNSAFAARREAAVAVPYDYAESTDLTTHATKVPGFPQQVFVATATVAAPGQPARPVPYTFTSDWVGGAQLGYVRTRALIDGVPRCYRGDLTVLGAVAISGAAFASAMGVMSQPFEVLLALSNARLGAWLPNPAWLREDGGSREWTRRRIPASRSEAYHVREVIDSHPLDDPLVLVTDGGHYDNLGLVEALRHRCSTVIVADSSGDPPPYATALLDALRLAEVELGVRVRLHDPDGLAPGSFTPETDDALVEPLTTLLPRLSRSAVVTGDITYPTPLPDGTEGATLVVVKTRLTRHLPYDVLAYANANPEFPYDSTADQWFDTEQFDAYHKLGRHLGDVAVRTLRRLGTAQWRNPRGNGDH